MSIGKQSDAATFRKLSNVIESMNHCDDLVETMEVEIKDLSIEYKKFSLKNISFPIHEGFITGVIGENGAGKTTLFKMLTNYEPGYTGVIEADGRNIREDWHKWMNEIGFIYDERKLFPNVSAIQNFNIFQSIYKEADADIFNFVCKEFEVPQKALVSELSRGEYIKLQIALELSHKAKLLIFDEATAGMDPVFRTDFFKMLHKLMESREISVLMSTHISEELSRHMDYVVHIENGEVVEFGEVKPA